MSSEVIQYKNWLFDVDVQITGNTYGSIISSGAEDCSCGNCKNYLAYREKIFPDDVKDLFLKLGIDYKKEFDVMTNQKLSNGFYDTVGWFHFKGDILQGENSHIPLSSTGYNINLTTLSENFSIGFGKGQHFSFFKEKNDLIEVTFQTTIPWIIDTKFEV